MPTVKFEDFEANGNLLFLRDRGDLADWTSTLFGVLLPPVLLSRARIGAMLKHAAMHAVQLLRLVVSTHMQ